MQAAGSVTLVFNMAVEIARCKHFPQSDEAGIIYQFIPVWIKALRLKTLNQWMDWYFTLCSPLQNYNCKQSVLSMFEFIVPTEVRPTFNFHTIDNETYLTKAVHQRNIEFRYI